MDYLKKFFLKLGRNLKEGGGLSSGLLWGLILAGLFLLINFGSSFSSKISATGGWYDNSWHYRKEIVIDHTKVSNVNQLNFPVLISITDTDLQAHARSDGRDILFTDSGGTDKIPYEREEYSSSTGTLVAWVRISNLSHLVDTSVYIYYGNSVATDQQAISGGTWDTNFKGVWHSNNATATTIADSTINANTGTKNGLAGPVETTGKIGQAQSYNGNDDSVVITPAGTLSGSFTVSVWAKSSDAESRTIIGSRGGDDMSFDLKFDQGEVIHSDIGDGAVWLTNEADASFSYASDTWYNIVYSVYPTGYTIYLDGENVGSGSFSESTPLLYDPTRSLYIGQVGYDDEWFMGAIDEVRVSDIVRSADWIKTEYNNQNSPATFYSVGSQETGDITPPTTPGIPQAVIGSNLTSQVWKWTVSTDAGSGVSHYDWRVDGGPSGTTTTASAITNLAVGTWKFHVLAEDVAGNQSAEQSSILAVLSSSVHEVLVDCSVSLVYVFTPNNVVNAILDLSPITAPDGSLLVANLGCEIFMETALPSATVKVTIPAGAAIKGPASVWSKIIIPPVAIDAPTDLLPAAPPGFSNQVALAIKIGHDVAPLDITRGTRIFISGQAGKKVGHISNDVFSEVANTCADDTQATGDALGAGQDCKIDLGSDLVIWTKHFSNFVTYNLVPFSTAAVAESPSATPSASAVVTESPTVTPSASSTPNTSKVTTAVKIWTTAIIITLAILILALSGGLTLLVSVLRKLRIRKR